MEESIQTRERDILQLIQSKKFLIAFTIFLIAFFALGWGILVWNENRVYELDESKITMADAAEYQSSIEAATWRRDAVSITDDYVGIYGWLIKPGVSVQKSAIHIVLKDTVTGIYQVVPTEVVLRTDVTELMNDGCTYDFCGFSVLLPHWDELDTDTDYELYAKYELNDEESVLVPLNTTLKTKTEELFHGQ